MSKEFILDHSTEFNGNIFLFYSFDVGDEIILEKIKKKGLVFLKDFVSSPYFKNYHIPLSFDFENSKKDARESSFCISRKVHHFGVLSFYYKVPFHDSLDKLKTMLVEIKKEYDQIANDDAKKTFDKINVAIKKPRFFNLNSFYFAVQVEPVDNITPEEYKDFYAGKIASLLRLETVKMSEYQEGEILSATTGYSGSDMMIIDSEGSFIYDNEYYEILEFFEFANIQQLELQYFDRLLDDKLNFFYKQQSYKVPLMAYVPLLGERFNSPVSLLAQLRVDISVISERLENSIKKAGDAYYLRVYSMLREKMSLSGWKSSINKKLDIIHDLYSVYQDRLDVVHEEILTLVIIILIALEALIAFMH
jgi:hypothetical protein